MNIKKFVFPTFEEWNTGHGCDNREFEKRDYQTSVGDYNLHIRATSWYSPNNNNDAYAQYQLGISTSNNPLNIYSNTIVNEYHKYYYENPFNERDLEIWYNEVTVKANNDFKEFIMKNYCEL